MVRILGTVALASWALASQAAFFADQIGGPGFVSPNVMVPNQNVVNNPVFTSVALDDFDVTATLVTNFVDIVARCTGSSANLSVANWGSTGPWQMDVYADNGSGTGPGPVILSFVYSPGSFQVVQKNFALNQNMVWSNALLRFNVSVALVPGKYWLSVVPQEPFNSGRTFWTATSNYPSGSPANKNALLYDPFNSQTYFPTGMDLAFRIDG
ncbi:MAG: hypothetical protein JST30_11135 [Armatimonadetes bacterium]|nr:hypothetical protein [Armatimonadota bacterium]